jgi:flagellar hook assembly protein FlgD
MSIRISHPRKKKGQSRKKGDCPFFLLFLAFLFLPKNSPAQQIFIDSIFTQQVNPNCIVQDTVGGVPRFICPPIPLSPTDLCSGISTPSCGVSGTQDFAGAPTINPDYYVGFGNISNDPHIEFDQEGGAGNGGYGAAQCSALAAQQLQSLGAIVSGSSQTASAPSTVPLIPWPSDEASNICNSEIYLCASIGYDLSEALLPGSGVPLAPMAIDSLEFEVFEYANGSNPLDPTSTPPLRTFFINNVGYIPPDGFQGCLTGISGEPGCPDLGPYCVPWDGSINIQGIFGKTNGQYGFRTTVATNETQSLTGNIQLSNVQAYPSGSTNDADFENCPLSQTIQSTPGSENSINGSLTLTSTSSSSGYLAPGDAVSFSLGASGTCGASPCIPLGTYNGSIISTGVTGVSFSAQSTSVTGAEIGGVLSCLSNCVGSANGLLLNGTSGTSGAVGLSLSQGTFANGAGAAGAITSGNIYFSVASGGGTASITGGSFSYQSAGSFTAGCNVLQQPITVNVVDVHVVRSSPTLVGKLTPVAAQPYNLTYRLSEDATMFIEITTVTVPSGVINQSTVTIVRHLVNGLPRVGEGYPGGTLTNGDAWDGRYDNGDLAPPGNYLVYLQAENADQYGLDISVPYTYPMSINPLQITDIAVTPLEGGSTSLAVIGYTLTEPATTFLDIYPPGVQFCSPVSIGGQNIVPLSSVENSALDVPGVNQAIAPPKQFYPYLGPCPTTGTLVPNVSPIQHIVQAQPSRTPVIDWWDGRDSSGNLLPDGNYVYVLYAELASQNGYPFNGNPNDSRIWTMVANTGFIPVVRGLVGISQITPTSTVVGSSPPVAGINPFEFTYTLTRDATVKVDIFNEANSTAVVRHLILGEARSASIPNTEIWDGTDDNGLYVSSGDYLVQLEAWDPAFPSFVSTTTAIFPVDMFRTTNLTVSPLLSGTTATAFINYEESNAMWTGINIYQPGTIIKNVNTSWPPCGQVVQNSPCNDVVASNGVPEVPFYQIYGMRSGRLMVSDNWPGIDSNGIMVSDGDYPFTLVAQATVPVEGGSAYSTDRIVGIIPVSRGIIGVPIFNVEPTMAKTYYSSQTVELDPFTINFELTRPSSVTINVVNDNTPPQVIRNLVFGQSYDGGVPVNAVWDGRDNYGNFPPPNFYTIVMTAQDVASENSLLSLSTSAATISYFPIQIYDLAVSPINLQNPTARIFYQVSEPMKVAVLVYRPNTQFPNSNINQSYCPQIGSPSPPAYTTTGGIGSLVKVLVSNQPPRQPVETDWDGTDLSFTKVPDGDYTFTIIGSTDNTAIDTITGQVTQGDLCELSIDQYIENLPVSRNGSLNPQGDFDQNTYAYPNPAYGPTVTFSIWVPFQGDVFMRIYTMAGELVYQHDFGQVPPAYDSPSPLTYVWNKDNEAGRPVAKGIYYVVFQAQETYGNKNFAQTVKKVLIP